jgi:signal peptidase I
MNEPLPADAQPKRKSWSRRSKIPLAISVGVLAVALYFLLPAAFVIFVAQPVKVEGTAMVPTLNNGDRIMVSKQPGTLRRGDIVVFWYPHDTSKSFIKRIIGLPGDKLAIDENGAITVNGEALDEKYLDPTRNQAAKLRWSTVRPEWKELRSDSYFLMGDNRDASNDSRSWGPVSRDLIYGKYAFRYWSSQ